MRKLFYITTLPSHKVGDRVELTHEAMSYFATIGYNPPLMHGTAKRYKVGLVYVSNGFVGAWFSEGLWKKQLTQAELDQQVAAGITKGS